MVFWTRKGRTRVVRRAGGFYIDEEILDDLDALALAHGLSLSALLDEVLREYLEKRKHNAGRSASDKRRFRRKKVLIPAMVYHKPDTGGSGRYFATTIVDISMGGMRMSIPLPGNGNLRIEQNSSEFEVIFSISEDTEPIRIKCRPQRIDQKQNQIQVGAAFSGSESESHERLHQYIM
jgi:hypothetical protein